MDLSFTEEELQFQQEVRQFLAQNLSDDIVEATRNNSRRQQQGLNGD